MGLGGFNDTSLPWPLKSSTHFAETPAHLLAGMKVVQAANFRQIRTGADTWPVGVVLNTVSGRWRLTGRCRQTLQSSTLRMSIIESA
jgi:hypothetical protein